MATTPSLVNSNGSFNIAALMQQLQSSQDAANTANDTRYNQSLANQSTQHGLAEGLYGQANTDIANVGQAANTRINQNLQNQQAVGQQGLISRGLGNTSIRDTVARGYNSDAELQHEQVDEQQGQLQSGLATQQAGYENQYGNQLSGIYESRSDQAPDTSLYANLIQNAMRAQTGSQPTTTTSYIGPSGRSFNNPGSAMASGGSSFNAPGGSTGGTTTPQRGTGGTTGTPGISSGGISGGNTNYDPGGGYMNSLPGGDGSDDGSGADNPAGAVTGAAVGGSEGVGAGMPAGGAVSGAAAGTGMSDPNFDYTPGAQHSDHDWMVHNQWLAAHGG